jgi:hypothetical protein
MAHPTEAELRSLGNEILDLLVAKTIQERDSYYDARVATGTSYAAPSNVRPIVEDYVRETYGFLPDTFASFAAPRPEHFDNAIAQCVATTMILQPDPAAIEAQGLGDVGQPGGSWPNPMYLTDATTRYPTTVLERLEVVQLEIAEWSGAAARAFHLRYMNEFDQALANQNGALFALAITIEANRKIFEHVGEDILAIGEQTKEALRNVTDKDPDDYVVLLTVGAAVAGVASAGVAAPGAAVLLAALGAASGLAALAVESHTSGDQPPKIAGATTQEIMVSVMERIGDLHELIRAEERKLVTFLESIHDWITGPRVRAQTELVLPEEYVDLDGASYPQLGEAFRHN